MAGISSKRSLSDTDIKGLLDRGAERRASNRVNRSKWPGPINMLALAHAVELKLPFVTFDGKRFKIRYTKFGKNGGGTVFVKPDSTAFIPCGYFSVKELKAVLQSSE